MGTIALDASVLIGFLNPADVHHEHASQQLAAARRGGAEFVLPATVLSESMVGQIRRGPTVVARLRDQIVAAFGPVRVVDSAVAMRAAQLRAANRSLRLPDALVIATGLAENASVLTFDRRLADVDSCVQVIRA